MEHPPHSRIHSTTRAVGVLQVEADYGTYFLLADTGIEKGGGKIKSSESTIMKERKAETGRKEGLSRFPSQPSTSQVDGSRA